MPNGIDLEVKKGEIVVSSALRHRQVDSAALPQPAGNPGCGHLVIDDLAVDLAKASDQQAIELRKRASFVFQNYALFYNKTALDNIAEG